MEFSFLITEGFHEIECIGKLLKRKQLKRITHIENLSSYWKPIIPSSFPVEGDLARRMPCPIFFQNENYSIAIHSAVGINQMLTAIDGILTRIDSLLEDMIGIGLLIDADYDKGGAIGQFNHVKRNLNGLIPLPNKPGEIKRGKPNTGIFVFPDNKTEGTLENVLLKCAEKAYSDIYYGAMNFVENIKLENLATEDKRDFLMPSGKNKSMVGCVGNILRPGKAIQVSIQDNQWISDQTIDIPEIRALDIFLKELLKL